MLSAVEQHLKHRLCVHYSDVSELVVVGFIRGGSLFKGTALAETFDIDLVCLLSMDASEFISEETQAKLKAALLSCLDELREMGIEVMPSLPHAFPSVTITLCGLSCDVLLGVSFLKLRSCGVSGRQVWVRQLQLAQDFILSLCDKEAMVRASRLLSASLCQSSVNLLKQETEEVKQTVVLLKHWRNSRQLHCLKSAFVEMIAIAAGHNLQRDGLQHPTMLEVFRECLALLSLSNVKAGLPRVISFEHLGLYDEERWTAWLPARPSSRLVLVNPLTPILDMLFSVTSRTLQSWSDNAEATLEKGMEPLIEAVVLVRVRKAKTTERVATRTDQHESLVWESIE